MIKAVILAAGAGTRMKSRMPKVMHELVTEPMLQYVIDAVDGMAEELLLVVGHGQGDVEVTIPASMTMEVVRQPIGEGQPYGTGFAVMQTLPYIGDEDEVLILCGDTPLVRHETLKAFQHFAQEGDYDGVVMTTILKDPTGYGRIIRDENFAFYAIREHKDCQEYELEVHEINGGMYYIKGRALKEGLKDISDDNAQGEYYLTDVMEVLRKKEFRVEAYTIDNPQELEGINSRSQLAQSEKILRTRINNHWMKEGVTFIDPDRTVVGPKVQLAPDVILWPDVVLEGTTVIGTGTEIRGSSRIVDSQIGEDCHLESVVIEEATVGNDVKMGPFAHLRPHTVLKDHVKIGNFVEVKNSTMEEGSKASHLAYVGDADVGQRVNIGCGVIFVNYDGERKYRSVVEDDAFIGSNVNVVSPVHVGKKAFVAAGSTLTVDVEEDVLVVARAREHMVAGWSEKRADKKAKED